MPPIRKKVFVFVFLLLEKWLLVRTMVVARLLLLIMLNCLMSKKIIVLVVNI